VAEAFDSSEAVSISAAERRYLCSPVRERWDSGLHIQEPRSGGISAAGSLACAAQVLRSEIATSVDVAAPRLINMRLEIPMLTIWATQMTPLRGFPEF
jgi:hypothetical protein